MSDLIQDRGRGPEIAGTRITVYNLLSSFLDASATEADIGRVYDLTAEQVAAARAYVLSHPEAVLAEHLRIEERLAVGNPPTVREQARRARETLRNFKQWLDDRNAVQLNEVEHALPTEFPTFREWMTQQESS